MAGLSWPRRQADIADQDTGAGYAVKIYRSTKRVDQDTGWQHESITLKPADPDYRQIEIPAD